MLRHQRETAPAHDPVGDSWRVYGPHGVMVYRRSLAPVPDLPGFDPADGDTVIIHRTQCWTGCDGGDDGEAEVCPGRSGCSVMLNEAQCHHGFHNTLEALRELMHEMPDDVVWRCMDQTYEALMPDPDLIPA